MPVSKPHYKRKMKKRAERQKFTAWAERRIDEWNKMEPEERKEHGEFIGFWRKRWKEVTADGD